MVHAADLREADMGFIHDHEEFRGVAVELIGTGSEEVQKAVRPLAGCAPVKVQ